ncbi:hypothetical protein Ahy_A02g008499 isoform E [Arachis hypogaea]|uniref:factor independent urate hydroxylase n=1 Tax=Arachis hypogaea TaxID=3818 RepID=A0A445EES2_ARAHY|nr:hypothetical protein Ahy_A02g008499 isoform E [Arachis hypogaea]
MIDQTLIDNPRNGDIREKVGVVPIVEKMVESRVIEHVTAAIVNIVEKPWERIIMDGQPHMHGFKLGSERHTVEAIVKKSGALQLTSGVEGLSVLKTTKEKHDMIWF